MESVRRLRKEAGLTQQQLSKLAGINNVTLVHIETGKANPNVETLAKLADALGVEMADFFPRTQPELPLEPARPRGEPVVTPPGEPVLIDAMGTGSGESFAAVTVDAAKLREILSRVARGDLTDDEAFQELAA